MLLVVCVAGLSCLSSFCTSGRSGIRFRLLPCSSSHVIVPRCVASRSLRRTWSDTKTVVMRVVEKHTGFEPARSDRKSEMLPLHQCFRFDGKPEWTLTHPWSKEAPRCSSSPPSVMIYTMHRKKREVGAVCQYTVAQTDGFGPPNMGVKVPCLTAWLCLHINAASE